MARVAKTNSAMTQPVDLQKAEAAFAEQVRAYRLDAPARLKLLINICASIANIKSLYKAVPVGEREHKTWAGYTRAMAEKYKLDFSSERMADNYVRLHHDLALVDQTEIQKRVSDASYRELRETVNALLHRPDKKSPEKRVLDEIRRAKKSLEKAAKLADEFLGKDLLHGHAFALDRMMDALNKKDEPLVPLMAEPEFQTPDLVRLCSLLNLRCRASTTWMVGEASAVINSESSRFTRSISAELGFGKMLLEMSRYDHAARRLSKAIQDIDSAGRPVFGPPLEVVEVDGS